MERINAERHAACGTNVEAGRNGAVGDNPSELTNCEVLSVYFDLSSFAVASASPKVAFSAGAME